TSIEDLTRSTAASQANSARGAVFSAGAPFPPRRLVAEAGARRRGEDWLGYGCPTTELFGGQERILCGTPCFGFPQRPQMLPGTPWRPAPWRGRLPATPAGGRCSPPARGTTLQLSSSKRMLMQPSELTFYTIQELIEELMCRRTFWESLST